jgi:hypothetical protein
MLPNEVKKIFLFILEFIYLKKTFRWKNLYHQ